MANDIETVTSTTSMVLAWMYNLAKIDARSYIILSLSSLTIDTVIITGCGADTCLITTEMTFEIQNFVFFLRIAESEAVIP